MYHFMEKCNKTGNWYEAGEGLYSKKFNAILLLT